MLKETFINLISKYSDDEAYNTKCWLEIEKAYSSKSRHYHNLDHLKNMLVELEKVKAAVEDIDSLLFSIFYHDIVYKATKSDNEHQSALLFEKRISKTSFSQIDKCKTQIELTKEHKPSMDADTNFLLDIDLSILGKSSEVYKKYTEDIRKEYKIYPDFMYGKGRTKVLESILELETIFKTDFFKKAYEKQARANLTAELNHLKT
tara:strand:+ start:5460 stop:6074 length:615 start_codon:yes stop_codon:yes gene_type:complete